MPTNPMTPETETAAPAAAATMTIRKPFEPLNRYSHVKCLGLAKHQQIEPAARECGQTAETG